MMIVEAVCQGRLVVDNPLGEVDMRSRALPATGPAYCVNAPTWTAVVLGDPPYELAALLDHVAEQIGEGDVETLHRAELNPLDLKRFTEDVGSDSL